MSASAAGYDILAPLSGDNAIRVVRVPPESSQPMEELNLELTSGTWDELLCRLKSDLKGRVGKETELELRYTSRAARDKLSSSALKKTHADLLLSCDSDASSALLAKNERANNERASRVCGSSVFGDCYLYMGGAGAERPNRNALLSTVSAMLFETSAVGRPDENSTASRESSSSFICDAMAKSLETT